MTEPVCAFHQHGRWYWANAPFERRHFTVNTLAHLPLVMRQLGAKWACGVLPYSFTHPLHGLPGDSSQVEVLLFNHMEQASSLPWPSNSSDFRVTEPFSCTLSRTDYQLLFRQVQNYLFAGDCYQINLAMAFNSRFHGSTYAGWHQLVSRHPAPHACYLSSSTGHVMSASPERFLSIENGNILTSPIKGSQPRGKTPEEDARLGRLLSNSKKDRAENLMIVDLLRNDLGAICETGSVVAEPLFELERFSNVQHLVSHIRGKLLPDMTPVEALISCFPGGSITGAPKRRAMEIIHELEPAARGAYCGSFFTLDDNGKLDANILIRTFQTQNDRLQIHGGSGITAASTCDNEYDECLFKVEKLMEALSQIPALPKES